MFLFFCCFVLFFKKALSIWTKCRILLLWNHCSYICLQFCRIILLSYLNIVFVCFCFCTWGWYVCVSWSCRLHLELSAPDSASSASGQTLLVRPHCPASVCRSPSFKVPTPIWLDSSFCLSYNTWNPFCRKFQQNHSMFLKFVIWDLWPLCVRDYVRSELESSNEGPVYLEPLSMKRFTTALIGKMHSDTLRVWILQCQYALTDICNHVFLCHLANVSICMWYICCWTTTIIIVTLHYICYSLIINHF